MLHWNIVPWYLGPASVKPTAAELAQGGRELRNLLHHVLTEVQVVIACGRFAQRGWAKHVAPFLTRDLTTIDTWHPSPQSFAQPGKRQEALEAFQRAAQITAPGASSKNP